MKRRISFVFLCLVSILLALGACSNLRSIGTRPHAFSQTPKKVIWFQIAGLSEEHFALVRFGKSESSLPIGLEQFSCLGSVWNYNLYDLRPSAWAGFLSQMTGSKNIRDGQDLCKVSSQPPAWNSLIGQGEKMEIGVFESGITPQESLSTLLSCPEKNAGYKNVYFWKMARKDKIDDLDFHHLETAKFIKEGIYFDKSCQQENTCYSSLINNVSSVFKRFAEDTPNYFFIIRDFSYQKLLDKGDVVAGRESLSEINKLIETFLPLTEKHHDLLLVVSSSSPRRFEFPQEGKEWERFERTGKQILFKNTAILSTVLAKGARAENFCGIYEESDLHRRFGWKEQGFQLFPFLQKGE